MVQLVELTVDMEDQYMDFCSVLVSEDLRGRWLFEYHGEPFPVLVQKLQDWKQGQQLPKEWVPASTFYLVRDDGKIIGKSSLRHELNEHLQTVGGHIGYIISADERHKGYGTEILRLTLQKAKELGLKQVLVTCDEDNVASIKIIEKNGGVLKDTYQENQMAVLKRRYWITL